MAGFPNQFLSRNSFIVLALVAAAAVVPQLFPLSIVSADSELLVNVANDQVTCSLCHDCDNPCPPSLPTPPPPPPPSPVIEVPPPPPPLPLPPPPPLSPPSPPPPALPPLQPPPLPKNCPPPPVPPICGACYSPPTGDQGKPPLPSTPPALPPPTTCTACQSPPSGGNVYGSPPPPTRYPGYGGGGGLFPPRPNIMTPYFPYDVPPPDAAATGRSIPLVVYFWMEVLLALHFIM